MTRVTVAEVSAEEWGRFLVLMGKAVDELAEGYVALSGLIGRGSGGEPAVGGSGTVAPAPVRLEVVDRMAEVEALVVELVPLVRGALRMGLGPVGGEGPRTVRTVRALRFLGASLRAVYEADPVVGERVTDGLWRARARVRVLTGEGRVPFRLAAACGECGAAEVWVRPDRWRSRCRACGHVEAASASTVFSSSSGGEG